MTLKYSIADYDEKYLEGVQVLFKETFNISRSKEFLAWENEHNPSGESIIKLAVENDRVIGHTCLWMFKLKLFEKTVLGAQSIDAMVKKDKRGKGVYEDIAMDAISLSMERGTKIRFNFPNELAYQASIRKINIKKICQIPQYLKVLDGHRAASMFTGNKVAAYGVGVALNAVSRLKQKELTVSSVEIKELEYFTEDFDQLWQNAGAGLNISVIRDSKYLNWRYRNGPVKYICLAAYHNGNLEGYVVLALEDKKAKDGSVVKLGHIADVLCKKGNSDVLGVMLKHGENRLKAEGACAVSCWMLNHSFYIHGLSNRGYLQLKKPAVLAALALSEDVLELGDCIYDQNNWYITIGDSDYI